MTTIKADLIRSLQQQQKIPLEEAEHAVNILLEVLKQTLEDDEAILINGFGKFSVRLKDARPGRNPKTKEEYKVSARKTVIFHASKAWRRQFYQ